MKKKLFENVGGNQFRLNEEGDVDYSKDAPVEAEHDAEKQFSVTVGGKHFDYLVTKMPDGTLNHYIDDANGNTISNASESDPKRLLTQDEVQSEVQKGLAQIAAQQAKRGMNISKFGGRRF